MPSAPPAHAPAPALAPGEVHLWRIALAGAWDTGLEHELERSELERAARFAFDRDRHRFLHGRLALRRLLARYTGLEPARVPLLANPNGKPLLDARFGLGFNLTHAGDVALLAVGHAAEIGVDVEQIRPREDLRALARSVFTAAELQSLEGTPDADLAVPFYTTWTRKEAYLKALGTGLTLEPRAVHVGTRALRERIAAHGRGAGAFVEVESLPPERDCIAALAVVGGFSSARFC